jgi:integration host factor subunit beta|tara:strand:- start:8198 stop:8488 length:291 start_codon:yes stop_codon:yes gene_type:complete
LSVSKSEIINKISKNFPNLYKKDIIKFFDIFLVEVTKALSNGERVELRDVMMFESRVQKQRISLNPRTLEKIKTPEKKSILFKCSKEWKKKLNEKK